METTAFRSRQHSQPRLRITSTRRLLQPKRDSLIRREGARRRVFRDEVSAEIPRLQLPRTVVEDRHGAAARLGKRMDFGAGAGAGPNGAGWAQAAPLAAPPPFLATRKPVGPPGQHQQMIQNSGFSLLLKLNHRAIHNPRTKRRSWT